MSKLAPKHWNKIKLSIWWLLHSFGVLLLKIEFFESKFLSAAHSRHKRNSICWNKKKRTRNVRKEITANLLRQSWVNARVQMSTCRLNLRRTSDTCTRRTFDRIRSVFDFQFVFLFASVETKFNTRHSLTREKETIENPNSISNVIYGRRQKLTWHKRALVRVVSIEYTSANRHAFDETKINSVAQKCNVRQHRRHRHMSLRTRSRQTTTNRMAIHVKSSRRKRNFCRRRCTKNCLMAQKITIGGTLAEATKEYEKWPMTNDDMDKKKTKMKESNLLDNKRAIVKKKKKTKSGRI